MGVDWIIDHLPRLIAGVLALVGVLLLWRGAIRRPGRCRRGAITSDHVVCGKCLYDRFGLPADSNCPECGANADAATQSRWQMSRPQLIFGLAALLLASSVALPATSRTWHRSNLLSRVPRVAVEWAYLHCADPARRWAVQIELENRYKDQLAWDQPRMADLALRRLKQIRERTLGIELEVSSLSIALQQAFASNSLSETQLEQFWQFAFDVQFDCHPLLDRAQNQVLQFTVTDHLPLQHSRANLELKQLRVNGRATPIEPVRGYFDGVISCSFGFTQPARDDFYVTHLDSERTAEFPDGKVRLEATIKLAIVDSQDEKKQLGTRTLVLRRDYEIRPGAPCVVSVQPDAGEQAEFEKYFQVHAVRRDPRTQTVLLGFTTSRWPSEPACFTGSLRVNGMELPLRGLVRSRVFFGEENVEVGLPEPCPDNLVLAGATVVLKPYPGGMRSARLDKTVMRIGQVELPLH